MFNYVCGVSTSKKGAPHSVKINFVGKKKQERHNADPHESNADSQHLAGEKIY
jgi:hypothetical protein